MKKLLVLGGTQFIGRNLIEALLETKNYDVTIFNRGNTNADLFPAIKRIKGDRNTDDILKIGAEQWDLVIDVSCYYPHSLENVLKALNGKVQRFVFVSTCSVYTNTEAPLVKRSEAAPILGCTALEKTDTSNASYGQRKAECERILASSGLDHVILRPALVYGRYDHTDRLYYWIDQVVKNSSLLVPDHGERLFSLTYVHDLVDWIIEALTIENHSNIYNVTSHPLSSIKKIIDGVQQLAQKENEIRNAMPEFLHQNKIAQWSEMPLWIDSDNMTFDNAKISTDFQTTITDFDASLKVTYDYYQSLNLPTPKFGMDETKRKQLIQMLENN